MRLIPALRTRWQDSNTAKRQAETFAHLWRSFESAGSVLDGRHDTAIWREQPGQFAACIVRVDSACLNESYAHFERALAELEGIRIHPRSFLHIMLQELGVLVEEPSGRRQISRERLEEFASAAGSALASAAPFEIRFSGANAFRDAVILEMQDGGALSRIHRRMHELAAVPTSSPYAFLPHLTVAHFTQTGSALAASRVIRPWRQVSFGQMVISNVEIVLLDVDVAYPALKEFQILPIG